MSGQERTYKNAGVSLVELTVTIAIIGFVVGAGMAATNLIHNVKRAAMATDLESLETATYNFQTIYGKLPGDMVDATSYFAGAVNGDGDCIIGNDSSDNERTAAFAHMASARLIQGTSYTVKADFPLTPITNTPPSAFKNNIVYVFQNDATGFYGGNKADKHFILADDTTGTGGIMDITDALALDAKLDDGSISSGKVFIANSDPTDDTGCVDSVQTAASPSANLGDVTENCQLMFFLRFDAANEILYDPDNANGWCREEADESDPDLF